jgi:TRAP-type transport system small permease protein
MNQLTGLDKFIEQAYKVIFGISKMFLMFQVIITSYVVFGRFILNKTPSWGEELSLMCMVWFSLLSAALAVKDDKHIRLSLVDMILPPKALKVLNGFTNLLIAIFGLFMAVAGVQLMILTKNSIMPGSGISSAWMYLSLIMAGLSIIIMIIGKVRKRHD